MPCFWLVKVDSTGKSSGRKCMSIPILNHLLNCLIVTKDGGFALAGYVILADGREDFRLVKTDSAGKMQWSQTYGDFR